MRDGEWFLSAGVRVRSTGVTSFGAAVIGEMSLVRQPAQQGLRPVRWTRSKLSTDGDGCPSGVPLSWRDAWHRAHVLAGDWSYQHRREHVVFDLDVHEARMAAPPPAPLIRAEAVGDDMVRRHHVGGRVTSFGAAQ